MKINEIFYSANFEGSEMGHLTVFVRTTGCSNKCPGCDTAYAFTAGKEMNPYEILLEIKKYPIKHVTITGGEPFEQPDLKELVIYLVQHNYEISIETSGTFFDETIARLAKIVVSPKLHLFDKIRGDKYFDTLHNWRYHGAVFKFVSHPDIEEFEKVNELYDKLHLKKAYIMPWEDKEINTIQKRKTLFLQLLELVKEHHGNRNYWVTPQFQKFLVGKKPGF